MRRIIVAVVGALAVLGVGATANAYPPDAPEVTVDNLSPVPGGTVTATVTGCVDGETVTFTLEDSSTSTISSGGTATGTVTAPTTPGVYTLEVVCGDLVQTVTITVSEPAPTPVPGLPATGGGGIGTTTGLALGLLVIGLGILGVGQVRRRSVRLDT